MRGVAVQLWIYDLSKGVARNLARVITRSEIGGIWHTSIVVFGREIWYGDGITITAPGKSRFGYPNEIMALGTTQIDEDTFDEFLMQMGRQFTADRYHLLDLPVNFLSTTFGSYTGPVIQAIYQPRRAGEGDAENASSSYWSPSAIARKGIDTLTKALHSSS
ncbi:hypothetical protein CPB86DRAFT_776407 [Serendipita vermifera]|nr:hypothetical protein CPB86DRAFT_776407 [Serendipita vermifera]